MHKLSTNLDEKCEKKTENRVLRSKKKKSNYLNIQGWNLLSKIYKVSLFLINIKNGI